MTESPRLFLINYPTMDIRIEIRGNQKNKWSINRHWRLASHNEEIFCERERAEHIYKVKFWLRPDVQHFQWRPPLLECHHSTNTYYL